MMIAAEPESRPFWKDVVLACASAAAAALITQLGEGLREALTARRKRVDEDSKAGAATDG